jgi:hypothetical protein
MPFDVDRIRVDDHDFRNSVVLEEFLKRAKTEGFVSHLRDESRSVRVGGELCCESRNDFLESSNDTRPQHNGIHLGIVERCEIEVVEKRPVNAPSQLGGRAAMRRRSSKQRDTEKIRTYAKLSVRREKRSGSTDRLVSQGGPVGRPVYDSNSPWAALDPKMNPADGRRR